MNRFWILSNLGYVFIIIVIAFYSIMFLIYKYLKKKTKVKWKLNLLKIVLILFPIYPFLMWYSGYKQELILEEVTISASYREACQVYKKYKGMNSPMPFLITGNGYYEFGNRWLLETTPILTAPIDILNNKFCLQEVYKRLNSYSGNVIFIIYEEENDVKKIVFKTVKKEIKSKKENSMFNEIYNSNIKPEHILEKQENHTEVTKVVLKYFKIGTKRESIISALSKMKAKIKIENNGNIIVTSKNQIKKTEPFPIVLYIVFKFDKEDKLLAINSVYYRNE